MQLTEADLRKAADSRGGSADEPHAGFYKLVAGHLTYNKDYSVLRSILGSP